MKNKNLTGYLYFYLHLMTEIVCFYYLTNFLNLEFLSYVIPFIYDGLAFVPQSIIGYINDKYPKFSFSLMGIPLLIMGILLYIFKLPVYLSLIFITLGNAFIHVNGAEVTLRTSKGKLAPVAIFVSGGSFGVLIGKLIAKIVNPWFLIPLILSMIPFALLASYYQENTASDNLKYYKYANQKINPGLILFLMVLIVICRGYIGYGIPTSWNKTTFETILLFTFMGTGKALGGILSDKFGIRKVGILSVLISIPFLCFGDKIMALSLIGVLLFSMTMSITLGVIVSILNNNPGLSFGLTTIGLFLGTIPIFFIKINSLLINCSLIAIVSIICAFIFYKTIKEVSDG